MQTFNATFKKILNEIMEDRSNLNFRFKEFTNVLAKDYPDMPKDMVQNWATRLTILSYDIPYLLINFDSTTDPKAINITLTPDYGS